MLAHLRKGETFADLAAGFGIGTATAWRYVRETVACWPPGLPKLRAALAGGEEGRARVRGDRRHPHPHRPGRG